MLDLLFPNRIVKKNVELLVSYGNLLASFGESTPLIKSYGERTYSCHPFHFLCSDSGLIKCGANNLLDLSARDLERYLQRTFWIAEQENFIGIEIEPVEKYRGKIIALDLVGPITPQEDFTPTIRILRTWFDYNEALYPNYTVFVDDGINEEIVSLW